jgi:hypothetical protein
VQLPPPLEGLCLRAALVETWYRVWQKDDKQQRQVAVVLASPPRDLSRLSPWDLVCQVGAVVRLLHQQPGRSRKVLVVQQLH